MKRFDIITIFPKILDSYFSESLIKKAQKNGLIEIKTHNLRDFTDDKSRSRGDRGSSTKWSGHRKVDDSPYGGGPGMVLKVEPIVRAVQSIKSNVSAGGGSSFGGKSQKSKVRVILLSLRGKKFDQKEAHRLAKYDRLIFICGRYEGVDERVAKYVADEELSVGDFVLSGGELPAAAVVEAVSRLIPGVLGKLQSLEEVKGTYPVYTKPEIIKSNVKCQMSKVMRVPKVLLSGNHKKIEEWRQKNS